MLECLAPYEAHSYRYPITIYYQKIILSFWIYLKNITIKVLDVMELDRHENKMV